MLTQDYLDTYLWNFYIYKVRQRSDSVLENSDHTLDTKEILNFQ